MKGEAKHVCPKCGGESFEEGSKHYAKEQVQIICADCGRKIKVEAPVVITDEDGKKMTVVWDEDKVAKKGKIHLSDDEGGEDKVTIKLRVPKAVKERWLEAIEKTKQKPDVSEKGVWPEAVFEWAVENYITELEVELANAASE